MFNKKIIINKSLTIYLILFFLFSIFSIYKASFYSSISNTVIKQTIWYILSYIILIFITNSKINISKYIIPFYIIMNLLLLGLLFFGTSVNNSKCWYNIGGIISFEPCEFMKISLILILGKIIINFNKQKTCFKNEIILITKVFFVVLIPIVLTFFEPDTGAICIYLVITFIMLFNSKLRFRWFFIFILIIISILGFCTYLYINNEDLFISIFSSDIYYRINRLKDFKSGNSFQLENALIGIGSAGLFGHGKMPLYFPEASTDFIFAVLASNIGFLGSLLFIILIVCFDVFLVLEAKKSTNYKYYLIIGLLSVLSFQQIQNIGMNIGLLPIMGITLPFISYGGSSLLSFFIILSLIYKKRTKSSSL